MLAAFRREDESAADRGLRRRIEGAVIAEELAAGEPTPRLADTDEGSTDGDLHDTEV
jgi:hypothetical protein